jgi:hypothetical protein
MSLCVCSLFVLSCVEVASLRRADPPSKESLKSNRMKVKGNILPRYITLGLVGRTHDECLATKIWTFHLETKRYFVRNYKILHRILLLEEALFFDAN